MRKTGRKLPDWQDSKANQQRQNRDDTSYYYPKSSLANLFGSKSLDNSYCEQGERALTH
jgi:hypothetical protein